MTSALSQAINVIKQGDKAMGRQLLVQVIKAAPSNKDAELAWLWLSVTVDDPSRKQQCLEKVLAINPDSEPAKQGLARLAESDSASTEAPELDEIVPKPAPQAPSSMVPHTSQELMTPDSQRAKPVETVADVNLANLMTLADAAASAGNVSEALHYYTKALELDPASFKAWYGKGLAAGRLSTLAAPRLHEMMDSMRRALSHAPYEERDQIQKHIAYNVGSTATEYLIHAAGHLEEFMTLDNSWEDYLRQSTEVLLALEWAHELSPETMHYIQSIISLCKFNIEGVKFRHPHNNKSIVWSLEPTSEKMLRQTFDRYVEKMRVLNPSYSPPKIKKNRPDECFIATAAFGDLDHPVVKQLRSWRDQQVALGDYIRRVFQQLSLDGPGLLPWPAN